LEHEVARTEPLEASLRAFAERPLGRVRARFRGWEHAESRVWELLSEDGRRAFLKVHRQPRKFRQELRAYREWLPQLPKLVPELIAVHEAPYALLLSAVPGTLAERSALTPEEERALHRQAGAFLRRLHDLPFEDRDPVPLAEAFRRRTEAWSERARGVVEDDLIGWVKGQVEEAVRMVAAGAFTRVPCHRDYTPRNWLVDVHTSSQLFVIDFEHARPDLWLADLEKLWSTLWPLRPDLEAAFWEGYERTLTGEEQGLLARTAALGAFTTVVWAREHGDRAFEAHGWRLLRRLRAAL